MKTILLLVSFCIVGFAANAQKMKESDVPSTVVDAFKKQYPDVKNPEWEKEGDRYEVGFDSDIGEMSVVMNTKGEILETEVETDVDNLPPNISAYVAAHYPGNKIVEASQIIDNKGKTSFEADIKIADLLFDEKGNFIKVENETNDDSN